jgi:hypothetical protein
MPARSAPLHRLDSHAASLTAHPFHPRMLGKERIRLTVRQGASRAVGCEAAGGRGG